MTYQEEKKWKMKVFEETIARAGEIILMVDGLDEVPLDFQRLLVEDLRQVKKYSRTCRLLITSRPYSSIRRLLKSEIQLPIEDSNIEMDIMFYIPDRISRHGQELVKHPGLPEYITREVAGRCNSSFLMAKLFMDEVLRAATDSECKRIIKGLPETAHDVYSGGLKRLSDEHPKSRTPGIPCLAIQALFWVAYARAPMTEEQLKQVLDIEKGDTDYNEKQLIVSNGSLESLCSELIIIHPESGEVRVPHKTFTEFLQEEETREQWFVGIREHIPESLMRYLSFECMKVSRSEDFERKHPLIPYAMRHWGYFHEEPQPGTALWKTTEQFLKFTFHGWNEHVRQQAAKSMGLGPGNISGMHWAVNFDLHHFVSILFEHERGFLIDDPVAKTPLGLAAVLRRPSMTRKLLNQGFSVNGVQAGGRTIRPPLYDAVFHGDEDSVALLLNHGADTTLRRSDVDQRPFDVACDQSPLDAACHLGRIGSAQLLASHISRKQQVLAQELQFLVRGAFIPELRKALEGGLNVNVLCDNGKQALDYAKELGDEEIIDILLANNAKAQLIWPAVSLDSPPYQRNLPESLAPRSAIIAEHWWGTSEYVTPRNWVSEGWDSLVLLDVAVDSRIKLPVQILAFETVSRDQGWSSHPEYRAYLGTSGSWIGIQVSHGQEHSQSFSIQHNAHASDQFRLHSNIWRLDELQISSPQKAQLMREIRYGSRVRILAYAKGVHWNNYVAFARVHIYGSSGELAD